MAKSKQIKKESATPEKVKGPKVDYTPKKPAIKKDQEVQKPNIVYHGECAFIISESGAFCSWNEASRQLCLDAAQEYIESYVESARPALYNFASRAALIENAKELTRAEFEYFGGQVTMGSHMKRQRFWKFIAYIANGRIPNDLRLRPGARNPAHLTGEQRAALMMKAIADVKAYASALISKGSNEEQLCRVSYLVGAGEGVSPVYFEAAPHDISNENMRGYKTLKQWTVSP